MWTVLFAGMVRLLNGTFCYQLTQIVISPYRAAFGINDVRLALVERAREWAHHANDTELSADEVETTLRQVVGGRVLQAVISDREGLAQEVAEIVSSFFPRMYHLLRESCTMGMSRRTYADHSQIEATAEKWGVAIESILLKDINFSIELQQSLSSAATQKRIGESKVIAARAEVDAAKLMRQGKSFPSTLLLCSHL